MTNARGRKRRSVTASFNDYTDLALASGGQAIQVTKGNLPEATDIILDTATSALVKPYSFSGQNVCQLAQIEKTDTLRWSNVNG
jgi:hypothetical protein